MERLERRAIGRVPFPSRGIVVIVDTNEILHVNVRDLGPIGVGVKVDPSTPDLVGKEVILVAETLIMYAEVARQANTEDGDKILGLAARKFPAEALEYLIDSIEAKSHDVE